MKRIGQYYINKYLKNSSLILQANSAIGMFSLINPAIVIMHLLKDLKIAEGI